MKPRIILIALTMWIVRAPVLAHHSTTMYQMANQVAVTGVVKRFEWTNPHAYIYLDVTGADGKTVEWTVELMSLNHLKSIGWTHNTVKEGDMLTCIGGTAKSGIPAMMSSLIKLGDGRMIRS